MWNLWDQSSWPSRPAAISEISSLIFFLGDARQELHLFEGVLRHAMQMSDDGDNFEL